MPAPLISICLPVLNARPFLAERMNSIFSQTFTDWELIVCESYSNDESWEYLQQFVNDARIHLHRVPRQGIYAGINACVQRARGDLVYIATADDTMMPDCLEKMIQALDAHPECGLAHCCLRCIDETGGLSNVSDWRTYEVQKWLGPAISEGHIRHAPLNALLHLAFMMATTSLTQLLIRRTVFTECGLFPCDHGSMGDYQWLLRVGCVYSMVHVPEYLATWRIHPHQASRHHVDSHIATHIYLMTRSAMPVLKSTAPLLYERVESGKVPLLLFDEALDLLHCESRGRRAMLNQRVFYRLFFRHPCRVMAKLLFPGVPDPASIRNPRQMVVVDILDTVRDELLMCMDNKRVRSG